MSDKKAAEIKAYTKFKAPRVEGKLSKDNSVVIRENMKMTEAEAKKLSLGFNNSGIYFELDAKATAAYKKAKAGEEEAEADEAEAGAEE